jgi:Flp pilus assembly pilin Flp
MLVFWLDETGAVSIEYGLIATLIAVAIFGAVGLIAPELTPIFDEIRDELRAG